MHNRKLILIAFILAAAASFAVLVSLNNEAPVQETLDGQSSKTEDARIPLVTLTIDDGGHVATYSGVKAADALSALVKVAGENGIPVKTTSYDFGVFVESIAGKKSTPEQAWIFFVNGVAGDVAADKKELHEGDRVEWRYVKPQ